MLSTNEKEESIKDFMSFAGVGKFYFGKKRVRRSYFRGHKLFINFEHVFWIFHMPRIHLFKLIFSVVTSFVLLSEEKISKKKKKKSKNPKKLR